MFDRVTGQPIWPIEEKPVPQGDVPGEWYSPTQPFPTKPPAYDRQGFSIDDLIDFTPELRAEAVKMLLDIQIRSAVYASRGEQAGRPLGTLVMGPLAAGPIGRADLTIPRPTSFMYIRKGRSTPWDSFNRSRVHPTWRGFSGNRLTPPERLRPLLIQGLPIIKPPYGQISAIDLDKGEILWQVAHGETPDNVRNSPALKGVEIPRTGRQGVIGTLVTKSLVIAGESGVFTLPSGQKGAMLRAYDKKTGKEMGAVNMPAGQTGSPMTYMLNGKQYLVVAIGGNIPAELIAFALPGNSN